ncbi:MAG: hypothetical protein JXA54_14070 [Candidatus Heimdallarchaeota archaeon]|nr:hypothetical protein [Candidatus Heimdallarchaeota archaeon]
MSKMEVYPITFRIDGVGNVEGELYRVKAPQSIENIWYALPISCRVRIQDNNQAHFLIDIQNKAEHPTFNVTPGDITYQPMSKTIIVFWEKTKPYAEVNVIGRITENIDLLKTMRNLSRVVIEKHT